MPVSFIQNASLASGVPGRSNLPAGSVLQVVSTFKNDVFSASLTGTSGGAWTDITGFSVSITPTSATSRILILTNFGLSSSPAGTTARLLRNSTVISNGATSGNRISSSLPSVSTTGDSNRGVPASISFLDSPATTSSITYKLQIGLAEPSGTYAVYFNTSGADGDFGYISRMGSSITVMEIAA